MGEPANSYVPEKRAPVVELGTRTIFHTTYTALQLARAREEFQERRAWLDTVRADYRPRENNLLYSPKRI